jgi:hypothetical protein
MFRSWGECLLRGLWDTGFFLVFWFISLPLGERFWPIHAPTLKGCLTQSNGANQSWTETSKIMAKINLSLYKLISWIWKAVWMIAFSKYLHIYLEESLKSLQEREGGTRGPTASPFQWMSSCSPLLDSEILHSRTYCSSLATLLGSHGQ